MFILIKVCGQNNRIIEREGTYSYLIRIYFKNIKDHIVESFVVIIGRIVSVTGSIELTGAGLGARVAAEIRKFMTADIARCSGGCLMVGRNM